MWTELPDLNSILLYSKIRIKTEEKAKVVAAVCGTELLQFFAALAIFHQEDLKKKMNRITATLRNGCFAKMDDHSVHKNTTIPKWMFSQDFLFK